MYCCMKAARDMLMSAVSKENVRMSILIVEENIDIKFDCRGSIKLTTTLFYDQSNIRYIP